MEIIQLVNIHKAWIVQ